MAIQFNKDRCLELLKEQKNLQDVEKLFWEPNDPKQLELIRYLSMIEDQIFWENRKIYIQIFDLFVRKKITLDQFFKKFFGLRSSNLQSARMLIENFEKEACGICTQPSKVDFQFNSKSHGITKIISHLHSLADLCDPDITFEMNLDEDPELLYYGISEEFLRLRIKDYFLPQLEKY